MIKTVNVNRLNMVRIPDTVRPSVIATNNDGKATVNIHFGANMDVVVIVAANKQLSRDNQERIRILTEQKQ